MNTTSDPWQNADTPLSKRDRSVIYGLLALLGFLHFMMVLNFEINWDEFFRLARVYEWQNGTLTSPFESNYVHAFQWLEHVHPNEVYQVIAGRCVMFALLAYVCWMMFLIMRRFFDRTTALITLICFLSFSFIFRHGTSFRIDLPITSLLITVVWLMICSKRQTQHFVISGILLGTAGAISIKSIFYVPTICVLLMIHWWQSGWKTRAFLQCVSVGIFALLTFGTLFWLHSQTLSKPDSASGFIAYASGAALLKYGWFPQGSSWWRSVFQNPIYWYLFFFGLSSMLLHLVKGQDKVRAWTLFACLLPLFSLSIYVHTYVYFYTFMLAVGSMLTAMGIHRITHSFPSTRLWIPVAVVVISSNVFTQSFKRTKSYQLQINQFVHQMFPEPVNYIDRTSMISSFPKQGLFMTNVQVDEYRTRGEPVMASVFEKTPPEFLLANLESLDLDKLGPDPISRRLMPEDEKLLVDNFIHHWGPIYVPGKILNGDESAFNIALAGTYTVEASEPVNINGNEYPSGSVIELGQGTHSFNASSPVVIRWGDNLYRPEDSPKGKRVFRGF